MIRQALPITLAAVAMLAEPALATEMIFRSHQPYWAVGERDDILSRLCILGRFNQRTDNQYVARFDDKRGAAVLGVAKGSGLNLYDPGHASKPKEDYFFRDDGTSECEVFVGGRPKKKLPAPGTAPPVPVRAGPGETPQPGTSSSDIAPAGTPPAISAQPLPPPVPPAIRDVGASPQ